MASKPIQFNLSEGRIARWLFVPLCTIVLYAGFFIWHFDIFSDPVRDNAHGWLGPKIRGETNAVDIGKVYYFEGTDFSLYDTYRPLCIVWLRVMGLSN